MTITVNLCVKKPKDYLKYNLTSFQINQSVNFPIKIIVEEVRNLTNKQKKKYSKIIKAFIGATISFLTLSSKSMANAQNSPTQQVVTTGLPPDLIEPIMELIKLAIGGSVLLSIILLILAGTMRQFRKKKEASEWSTDIIKGFIQVLLATPIIFLMYYVVTKLLGNFSMFLKPF